MYNSVIVGYSRSPFAMANKGKLIDVKPVNLLAEVIKNLVSQSKFNPKDIEDVVIGCAFQVGDQCFNIGRLVTFLSDLDIRVPGMTVDRWCGSSMEAIHIAAGKIAMGSGKAFICGGVESMTRVRTGFDALPYPYSDEEKQNPHLYLSMGITAENVAKKFQVTRDEQDKFALHSQEKALKAQKEGKFKDEIINFKIKSKNAELNFEQDEHPRKGINLDTLSRLKPVFKKDGTVTAGNASGINDGAAAVTLMTNDEAEKRNIEKLVSIKSWASCGVDPALMGTGPIPSVKKALDLAGWTIKDVDLFEINEAFAAQSLAVIKTLSIPSEKVNVNGGAIALGHPIGASGTRILVTLIHEMIKRDVKKGLATLCIGGGMGIAMCVER